MDCLSRTQQQHAITEVVVKGGEGKVRAVVSTIHIRIVEVGGMEVGARITAVRIKGLRAHGVENGIAAGIRRLLGVHIFFHYILKISQGQVIAGIYSSYPSAMVVQGSIIVSP